MEREGEISPMQKCWELAAARGPQARVPHVGQCASGKGGLGTNFLHPSGDGVKKAPGAGVKSAMPVRQATEMDLAARPVEREPAPGTGQIRGASRQAARRGDTAAPASRGHLLRAGSSLCLVVGSICSCTESRGEGGEQREKAQLVDEQRETCRKPSPQNTRNR